MWGIKSERKFRQERLARLIDKNPMATDEELALSLSVSVGTVRLDRALLGVPELRERIRRMAREAGDKLKSLSQSEIVGDLIELEPNRLAISVMRTARDMATCASDFISDRYVYAQAGSLAVAVIEAASVMVESMRGKFKKFARVGDVLVARAKAGAERDGRRIVSVRTRVGTEEIFVGRFIMEISS
ncbi:MAG: transcription factor FapR [Synergistaceae bacterium]|nr:transcription factor FapR [Synergistaceae bacterium]